MLGHTGDALALLGSRPLDHFAVEVGVGADQIPVGVHLHQPFQLQPLDPRFAGLAIAARYRSGYLAILLAQIEHRSSEQRVAACRLVLHPEFPLLALERLVRLLRERVEADDRAEGLAVADVGRHAIVEQIGQTDATGDRVILLPGALLDAGVSPVLAQAQSCQPLVETNLVLNIEALLGNALLRNIGKRDAGRIECAVDRIVKIQRGGGSASGPAIGDGVPVVHTDERGVLQRAGVEAGFGLMIGAPDGHLRLGNVVHTIDRAVVGAQYWRPSVYGLVADLALLPAQVLPQCPGVVDTPGHLRGQGLLLGVVLVESGLADEALAADLAIGCAEHGAAVRQEGAGGATVVLLHVGHQCPFELLVGAPGQRRHEQQAVVLGVIDLSLAVALNRHHAIQQCAVVIERAGAVEGDLLAIEAAVLHLQLASLFGLWTLADEVEQAADRTLPVEHGRRSLDYLDAFQGERIGT